MNKYWKEFREFSVKGNVVDLAVAVIIGSAFGKIVSSLVADIIMPLISVIVGGINFSEHKWILKKGSVATDGSILQPEVTVNIGNFIQNIFDFFVIALAVFFMVRLIMRAKKTFFIKEEQKEEETEKIAVITEEQRLLAEIRDILKDRKN
jgi:large conductance mechanosensitive channel